MALLNSFYKCLLFSHSSFLGLLHILRTFAQQQKEIGKNLQLKVDSGCRVEAGPTRKYVLMKKPQPDPIEPDFGPWGLNLDSKCHQEVER